MNVESTINLKHELLFGRGWSRVTAGNIDALNLICKKFVSVSNQLALCRRISDIDDLRKALIGMEHHKIYTLKTKLAQIENLSFLLQSAFSNVTLDVTGKSIYLQRRTHIMFNIPGNIHTATMQHMDAMSGISPHSFILWAPIHDIEDDSGMYLLDQNRSMKLMQEEKKYGLVMSDQTLNLKLIPEKVKFGEGILFNPFVIHGSIPNTNAMTRIGITNRFQDQSKPLYLRNSEFFYPCQIDCKTLP